MTQEVDTNGCQSISRQVDDLQVSESAERVRRHDDDAIACQVELLQRRVDGECVVANSRDTIVGQPHDLDVRVKVDGDRGETKTFAVGRLKTEDGDDLAGRGCTVSSDHEHEHSNSSDKHRREPG